MKHRGRLWKWMVAINGVILRGQAATKSEAIAEAGCAIERLGVEKIEAHRT